MKKKGSILNPNELTRFIKRENSMNTKKVVEKMLRTRREGKQYRAIALQPSIINNSAQQLLQITRMEMCAWVDLASLRLLVFNINKLLIHK